MPVHSQGLPIADIAQEVGIPEDCLIPLLRQLTSINIFREPAPLVFAHTSVSAVLAAPEFSNATNLMLHMMDEGFKSAGYFPESLDLFANQFDKVQKQELRTAFNLAFRTDQHFFDYIYSPENSRYGERFNRAMLDGAPTQYNGTVHFYDWSTLNKGDKIVDVGGGMGHVSAGIAEHVESGVEIIVQDQLAVIEQGRAIYGPRIGFQVHNFLEKQPEIGARVYLVRRILHGCPDAISKRILGHLHDAMGSQSTLLIFDLVAQNDSHWAVGMSETQLIEGWSQEKRIKGMRNINMTNFLGSKERTEKEWSDLLGFAGFQITRISGSDLDEAMIEAVKR